MSNLDLTVLILDKLGWFWDDELNKNRYAKTKPVFAGDLVFAILENDTVEKAAKALNFSYKVLNTSVSKYLVSIFGNLNGGNETWKYKLLRFIEYKTCPHCRITLNFSEFNLDISSSDGKYSICKKCRSIKNSIEYLKDSTQKSHRKSYFIYREKINARNAGYKALRDKRIPIWSETDLIEEFYKNCPAGHHVDHILPLRGEFVSGLHVFKNLQYLTSIENLKKSNKYMPE